MNSLARTLTKHNSRRWWINFPYLLALITLFYIGWAGWTVARYPYDGIQGFHPTGLVSMIDPNYPSQNTLQQGDLILTVDGVPFREAIPLYSKKHIGDTVTFSVLRNNETLTKQIALSQAPVSEVIVTLIPLLVALIFLMIGVGVQAFRPVYEGNNLFFLFFLTSATLLVSGFVSSIGPPWSPILFSILIWIFGPLAVHFHFYFPQVTNLPLRRPMLTILYMIGLIGSLFSLYLYISVDHANPWYVQAVTTSRLYMALNLLLVVTLLIYTYRYAISPGVRSKIRIVVLGGVLSLLPFIQLTILPDALLHKPIIPYAYSILLLGIVPATYGYAIFRHRLIEIEKHINRGATFILMYSILGAIYLVVYATISFWIPTLTISDPLFNTILVLFLASLFVPIQRRVQRLVDTVFYGGWYDYRSAVTQISQGLEHISELQLLASTLAERLADTLRLEDACVFLRDSSGDFSVVDVAPLQKIRSQIPLRFSTLPRSSLTFLLRLGDEVGRSSLREALSEVRFTPEETELLNTEQDHLWIPIIGHSQVQGMIALGPKYGGDIFSNEDIDILRIISRQIGPLIENIHLLTELRRHAADLEKRVEDRTAELYNAKERVEAILASVGDGVFVTDLDNTITTVNKAYEEQSGVPAQEIIGKTLFDLLTEKNDPAILDNMRSTLQEGKVWIGELLSQHKNGTTFNIQLTVAPVRDQSGQMVGFVGSQRDITRQTELARLKDIFVSDVSHELRTPTSNISLYLELLESAPSEKRKHYLNVLMEQSQLLRKLVEDILDLSRLTMGKTKRIEFTSVDLNAIIHQVVSAHAAMAEVSSLELIFKPENNIPPVYGEPNQLARLITNLVANALRYTPEGQVVVRTYTDNHCVCLDVADTGMGIEVEDQSHLFERFYRGRKVRQSPIHGTGLGLAIVKEIVDLHDGEIDVVSKSGEGSTFTVRFPIHEVIF